MSTTTTNVSYFWYADSALTQLISNSMPFVPSNILSDTVFYLQVENISGCLSNPQPYLIQVNAAPTISIDVDLEACEGDSLVFSSLTNANSFLWSGPNGFYNTAQTALIFPVSSASAGQYSLTASDTSGCLFKDTSFTVQINSVPINLLSFLIVYTVMIQ